MREITSHKVNGCNEAITITAVDEPGAGGANHRYFVEYPTKLTDAMRQLGAVRSSQTQVIHFQNGPIAEAGVNGLTQEVLLAIVADRLECFQRGPYACVDNELALASVRQAMRYLQHRTRARVARGVEGTSAV